MKADYHLRALGIYGFILMVLIAVYGLYADRLVLGIQAGMIFGFGFWQIGWLNFKKHKIRSLIERLRADGREVHNE